MLCRTCKVEKELTEFYPSTTRYRYTVCRACDKPKKAAHYKANREAYLERRKRWHKENPGAMRRWNLKKSYGITESDYDAMYAAQDGRCKICNRLTSEVTSRHGTRRLHVDHDHVTGRVRGLLCHQCNTMLGLARDDEKTFESAIRYLKQFVS